MARVVLKRENGLTIEADLTFEQIKELVGVNGYHAVASRQQVESHSQQSLPGIEDFDAFYNDLPERGKLFIKVLREHPKGIDAATLAPLLDFESGNQIGGLTGGGLSKTAKRHSIKVRDIYTTDVKFPDGKRRRMFYPGKLLK